MLAHVSSSLTVTLSVSATFIFSLFLLLTRLLSSTVSVYFYFSSYSTFLTLHFLFFANKAFNDSRPITFISRLCYFLHQFLATALSPLLSLSFCFVHYIVYFQTTPARNYPFNCGASDSSVHTVRCHYVRCLSALSTLFVTRHQETHVPLYAVCNAKTLVEERTFECHC